MLMQYHCACVNNHWPFILLSKLGDFPWNLNQAIFTNIIFNIGRERRYNDNAEEIYHMCQECTKRISLVFTYVFGLLTWVLLLRHYCWRNLICWFQNYFTIYICLGENVLADSYSSKHLTSLMILHHEWSTPSIVCQDKTYSQQYHECS